VKAIMRDRYGPPDVLELRKAERPVPGEGRVLVRVAASSVNPADWHYLTGLPYLVRLDGGLRGPKQHGLGMDLAGTVEEVGPRVTGLRPGDEVFGSGGGAFAEYALARADRLAPKPTGLSFEEAAAVPVAAATALQGLRDKGGLAPGQSVLINGASGGVGTFAVQIAKALGARVTAVCSTRNVEQARALGADEIVDYTREDFTRRGERHDLLLDIVGGRSWSECTRVLAPDARLVVVGGPKRNRVIGPLGHMIRMRAASLRGGRTVRSFIASVERADLETLARMLQSGAVRAVVQRTYPLAEVAEALRYLAEGHAQGKLAVSVTAPAPQSRERESNP
jgi:NADPH:quinone reductase-like Zn-dependent oxidoreductase